MIISSRRTNNTQKFFIRCKNRPLFYEFTIFTYFSHFFPSFLAKFALVEAKIYKKFGFETQGQVSMAFLSCDDFWFFLDQIKKINNVSIMIKIMFFKFKHTIFTAFFIKIIFSSLNIKFLSKKVIIINTYKSHWKRSPKFLFFSFWKFFAVLYFFFQLKILDNLCNSLFKIRFDVKKVFWLLMKSCLFYLFNKKRIK